MKAFEPRIHLLHLRTFLLPRHIALSGHLALSRAHLGPGHRL
jgi:hypothetical protein